MKHVEASNKTMQYNVEHNFETEIRFIKITGTRRKF